MDGQHLSSMAILLALKQVLEDINEFRQEFNDQRARIEELENTVVQQQYVIDKHVSHLKNLEARVNCADAYSGRTTVILSNIQETENEPPHVLAEKVAAATGVQIKDIGHIHRNRTRKEGKPRTITLQMIRAVDKDKLIGRKKELKRKNIGVYHHMTPGLIKTKEILEKANGVNWVAYGGHSRMFTVNYANDKLFTRVLSADDFIDKLSASAGVDNKSHV